MGKKWEDLEIPTCSTEYKMVELTSGYVHLLIIPILVHVLPTKQAQNVLIYNKKATCYMGNKISSGRKTQCNFRHSPGVKLSPLQRQGVQNQAMEMGISMLQLTILAQILLY